jgi:hypothetical protein
VHEIKNVLTREQFAFYKKMAMQRKFLLNLTNRSGMIFRFCPQPDCDEEITLWHKKSRQGIIEQLKHQCPKCFEHFCRDCGEVWHPQRVCEDPQTQWDMVGRADTGTANRCPKCKSEFEKASGCQHMTCAVCEYEWCWLCGLPYHSIVHYAQFGGLCCELIGFIQFS